MNRVGGTPAENHVVAVLPAHRVADVAALLEALVLFQAVVPAARTLEDAAPDGGHVADLGRSGLGRSDGEGGVRFADALVIPDVGQLHQGADAQSPVRLDLDFGQAGNPLEVHQARRFLEVFLEMVDDVDAARLVDAPGFLLNEILRLDEGGGLGDFEAIHGELSPPPGFRERGQHAIRGDGK